ncbi:MAG: hypothetical protein KGM16_02890 [Bacteroidota bacterium]|nr:hypothetical protein [Bacteroidota bacterium]
MNTETNYAELYYSDLSIDAEAIENNVRNFPVSSVARFLRLYHLKKNNDPRFEEVAKQTGIYLHNPYWMEFQLSKLDREPEINDNIKVNLSAAEEENSEMEISNEVEKLVDNDLLINENYKTISGEISNENTSGIIDSKTEEENLTLPVNEQISKNFISENEGTESTDEEFVAEPEVEIESKNWDEVVESQTENEGLAQPVNEQISKNFISENEVTESAGEELVAEPVVESESENWDEVFKSQTEDEGLAHPVNEQISENLISENEVAEQQDEETAKEETVEPGTQLSEQPNEVYSESEPAFKKEESVFDIKIPATEEKITGEETSDSETNTEEEDDFSIPFEPLHTVDYFASQGIKLSEEALNDDQLGKQVKSFTAWLKSMKKLHPGQLPEQNEVIEKLIQTSSEVSNKSANVLTEAMAEVLLKQGKREKAIEMYEKLSLINPSKSAYFAAKIESLKII